MATAPPPPVMATWHRHAHREAYHLMQYQDEDDATAPIEWIWNSRDGVTPYIVSSVGKGRPLLKHIRWKDDIFAPQYVPMIGQRVFVSLTESRALHFQDAYERRIRGTAEGQRRAEILDRHWDNLQQEIARGGPDVVVCTLEMQRQFAKDREGLRGKLFGEALPLLPRAFA